MSDTTVTRRSAMGGAAALALGLTSSARAQTNAITKPPSGPRAGTVTGVVYESSTGGPRQPGERGVAGVQGSNGHEIVRTEAQGRYSLPVCGEGGVFVLKPIGCGFARAP